jgi:transmembrane sensor
MSTERPISEDARLTGAADWVVRLQSDGLAPEDALAFDAWLEASPANARAYDAALATWTAYGREAAAVAEGLRTRRGPRPLTRRFYLGAGAIAAAAAVAVVALPMLQPQPAARTYATAKGEHRTVTLADGTRIDLNADTRLTVRLERGARQVTMDEGQAVFDVAHDTRRPFLVAAGDRTVRVVGTQFDVRRRAGKLSVTVARGAVEVRPSGQALGAAYRLHPGQRFDHVEGAREARVDAVAADEVLGWRTGRLVYRDQPLSEVVADLNAQFRQPITIEDPKLAATPISGVLVVDGDESAVIRRLALLVSARAVRSGPGVVLRR